MSTRASHHLQTGSEGEDLAISYLERKGWTILERNYRFERSEVDIVAYDQVCIVFLEVKTRRSSRFGYPEESVDERKQAHIHKASMAWLYERKMEKSPIRFDVIGIELQHDLPPIIEHIERAF